MDMSVSASGFLRFLFLSFTFAFSAWSCNMLQVIVTTGKFERHRAGHGGQGVMGWNGRRPRARAIWQAGRATCSAGMDMPVPRVSSFLFESLFLELISFSVFFPVPRVVSSFFFESLFSFSVSYSVFFSFAFSLLLVVHDPKLCTQNASGLVKIHSIVR